MIAMGMNEENAHAIDVVDAFAKKYLTEENVRQWIKSRGVPKSVYQDFYASELGSYVKPANIGGKSCGFVERAAVIARLTEHAGATLPFLSDMISMALLSTMRELSQEEITHDFMVRNGRVSFSQAFTEANAGTDASAVKTTVSLEDGGIYLDGRKSFVSNGQFAPETLVLASDPMFGGSDGGFSLWLVPLSRPGIATYPLNAVGQEMLSAAAIEFHHVRLAPEWQIQTEGRLDSMLKRQYELGRILVCASSLGLARAAFNDAAKHAATHMVKGRLLASIPRVQEKLTNMEIKLRSMQSLVVDAANAADQNSEAGESLSHLDSALMKYYVPKAATEVADDAMQIFGAMGYTDETRVSRIWRDCRGNQLAQGSDDIMAHVAAKFIMAEFIQAKYDEEDL